MEQPFQEESSQEETTSSEQIKGSPAVNVASKNWKAGLAFSKVAPMPAKNWKKDFDQFSVKPMEKKTKPSKTTQNTTRNDDGDVSDDSVRKVSSLKRTPLKRSEKTLLRKTPLAQIGKKKKDRLKNEGSEVDVFRERWEKSDKMCQVCGEEIKKAFINGKLIKPQCFPHILAKGMYPRFRLLLENIGIVCSINCHSLFDEMHLDLGVRRELEEKFNSIISQKESGSN